MLELEWVNIHGLMEYTKSLKIMEHKVKKIISGQANETVYVFEYEDVYTAGTNYKKEELVEKSNIPVIYTGRGGKYTYHGPGQSVIYPLINLTRHSLYKNIKLYVHTLEKIIINTLNRLDVDAYTMNNQVGVWVNKNNTPAKIGAIGIRVKKWIAYHGIAINITTDLQHYKRIIPCGISKFPVTSLRDLGITTSMQNFNILLKEELNTIFQ